MSNTKIVMVVEDGLSEEEKRDLRYIFADALHDFQVARGREHGAEEYVAKRYPNWVGKVREEKVSEVRRRLRLAIRLHNTVLGIEFVDELSKADALSIESEPVVPARHGCCISGPHDDCLHDKGVCCVQGHNGPEGCK